MPVTNNIKKGIDLPVFEWLRPLPVNTSGPSSFATGGKPFGRYIFYQATTTNNPWRYDTFTDSWTALAIAPQSFAIVGATRYNDNHGYFGRAIGNGGGANTMQAAVPPFNRSEGYEIKILRGRGAGQVRTILEVADTVHETMYGTGASNTFLQDSNKAWAINQYRDHNLRIIGNTNTDIRKILRNNTNTMTWADATFMAFGCRYAYPLFPYIPATGAGIQTIAQIESSIVTVSSAWDVTPDSTSEFVIRAGGIWNVNVALGRFACQYYDVLADTWYQNNSPSVGIYSAALGTDVSLESFNETAVGVMDSGVIVSGAAKTVTVTTNSLSGKDFRNYVIHITRPNGTIETRGILSHTASVITVIEAWTLAPTGADTFAIRADNEKILMWGNAGSGLLQYDADENMWSDRRILEGGCPNNISASWAGCKRGVGITSITRTGGTATASSTLSHPFRVGDVVTIRGCTDSTFNDVFTILTIPAIGTFTFALAGTVAAVASNSQSTTQLVDPSKNWVVNEHAGKVVSYTIGGYAATTFNVSYAHRVILSNTATTLVFAAGTAPITGTTAYVITDLGSMGAIRSGTMTGTPTTTLFTDAVGGMATNAFVGRRILVIDGANWAETTITANTANTITMNILAFTPTANAFYSILGNGPCGTGVSLEFLYGTTALQKGKFVFATRGGNTNHFYRYDISDQTWIVLSQIPNAEILSTGSMTAYDGADAVYIGKDNVSRLFKYNFKTSTLESGGQIPFGHGIAVLGNRMAIMQTPDGVKFLYIARHTGTEFWRMMMFDD